MTDHRDLRQIGAGGLGGSRLAVVRRCPMPANFFDTPLVAYLNLREALGFQMRAEKTLLPDFVAFVKVQGPPGPIRTQLA